MAEGSSAYNGLAVGLYGEHEITQVDASLDMLTLTSVSGNTADFLICQNSEGTELLQYRHDGRLRLNRTCDHSDGSNTLDVYMTQSGAHSGAQQGYAATFKLDESTYGAGSGRNAVLCLWYDSAGGGSNAAHSFIHFDGLGTTTNTLFTINGQTTDASLFVTTNQSATRGLRIFVNNVEYYILLGATS
jgi:hypothetical protein